MSGIIYILFGLVLLFFPTITRNFICYLLGGLILVYGIIHVLSFFILMGTARFSEGDLVTGLISSLIGIFVITKAGLVISTLPFVIGIVIAVNGVFNIGKAVELKKLQYKKWIAVLAMAVLTAALGLVLIFNPLQAADFAISLVGIGLLVTGVCDIWAATRAERILSEEEPRVIVMDDGDF